MYQIYSCIVPNLPLSGALVSHRQRRLDTFDRRFGLDKTEFAPVLKVA
jgi:hypothetical protein